MEKNNKIDCEKKEYEDVKHLSVGAFIAIGLAFGSVCGFSAGNLFFGGNFVLGIAVCTILGFVAGLVMGLINKRIK